VRLVVTALAAAAALGSSCLLHRSDADSGTAAPSAASPPAAEAPAAGPGSSAPVPGSSDGPGSSGESISWGERHRRAELFPPSVLAHAGRLFPEQPDVPVGPAFRDLSPPAAYHEANRSVGAAATLDAAGRLVGHVAGRPFGPDAIDCAGEPQAAGLRLAWSHALAWEGDGAAGAFRVTRDADG